MLNANSTPHASDENGAANQAGSFSFPMKPPLSFRKQLKLMQQRGLVISDEEEALVRLSQTNYYRLRGYWLTFEQDGIFKPETTFDAIWDSYELDRELRQILWAAIEPIEVKARTSLAYHLSMACGPDSYEDSSLFLREDAHSKSMANVARERDRALRDGVPCVKHNMQKYGTLPAWAAVEIMSMGTVSQLYGNLGQKAAYANGTTVRDAIAHDFRVTHYYLKSWLRHLTYVRNICGHHSRLYNRVMTTRAKLLKVDSKYESPKEFPSLLVLKRLYENSWPDEWKLMVARLEKAISKHAGVPLAPMGFPENWTDVLMK